MRPRTLSCQGNASYSRELAICQPKQSPRRREAGSEQSCHAAHLSNIHARLSFTTTGHVPARSPRSHPKTDELRLLERVHSLDQPPTHPPASSLCSGRGASVAAGSHSGGQTYRPCGRWRTHLHRRTREERREGSTGIRAKAFTSYRELQMATDTVIQRTRF